MARDNYAYSYYGTTARKLPPEKREEAQHSQKRKKAKIKRVKVALGAKACFAVVVAAVFLVVMRFTMINELAAQAATLQKQLQDVTAANEQASVALNSAGDLKKVEEVARNELGMDYPQPYQVIYVTLEQEDKAVKPEPTQEGWFDRLKAFFSSTLEYLY